MLHLWGFSHLGSGLFMARVILPMGCWPTWPPLGRWNNHLLQSPLENNLDRGNGVTIAGCWKRHPWRWAGGVTASQHSCLQSCMCSWMCWWAYPFGQIGKRWCDGWTLHKSSLSLRWGESCPAQLHGFHRFKARPRNLHCRSAKWGLGETRRKVALSCCLSFRRLSKQIEREISDSMWWL